MPATAPSGSKVTHDEVAAVCAVIVVGSPHLANKLWAADFTQMVRAALEAKAALDAAVFTVSTLP